MSPESRAARVRFLFLDVDGTMTNGRLYRSDNGDLWRAYHVLDGYGLRRLIKNGCPAAIVTAAAGGDSIVLRMQELGINRIHQGVDDKLQTVKTILAEENIAADAAAYMGDDLPDLQAMQYVGLACAPQSAIPAVLAAAHYVPPRPAGAGALRDVCDFILANRRSNL
ncbi:MAG: HAD hydrolase family protein [Candidatus Zeuxoniibacter abyssi]|nr:MAG: HAD hydrolase family protein [Candidatus Persebacteraceae bacterium AB1(2)]